MYPVPGETGRVELMEFAGLEGRDLSARAVPPNLGILSVRFPLDNLQNKIEQIKKQNWPLSFAPARVKIHPYGEVEIFTVRSPEGAMIDFFQQQSQN